MHYILAKRHLVTLAHFASSNVVLAFDYDGTLAPIVSQPDRARLRPTTRELLGAVARRYPCIVISGRRCSELTTYLDGVPLWHVFGNHGLEPWRQRPSYEQRVRAWLRHLRCRLPAQPGLAVEDKTYSIAIHYRKVRRKRAVKAAIREAIAGLQGSRIVDGKQVVNIVPRGAPHKGTALEHARRLLACDCAVFVGDDHTDEDAFTMAPPERVLTIRVGPARNSAAGYYLKSQSEIDSLLRALLRLRSGQPPPAHARDEFT